MNLGKALLSSLVGSQIVVPTVAGTPFQGGYYVGRMKPGDGFNYALIVSPKVSGESSLLQLKTTNTTTVGTSSIWDGAANTTSMISAGAATHPAANFCKNLSIGGYTDWAVPAKDQLELLYRVLKPTTSSNNTAFGANPSSDPIGTNYTSGAPTQTNITDFKTGGSEAFSNVYYWTSTENGGTNTFLQNFIDGTIATDSKTASYRVRAVRMIKI